MANRNWTYDVHTDNTHVYFYKNKPVMVVTLSADKRDMIITLLDDDDRMIRKIDDMLIELKDSVKRFFNVTPLLHVH
jgi:hypothetical protein